MASNRRLMRNGGIIGNCNNSKISTIKQNKGYQKGCLSALSNILKFIFQNKCWHCTILYGHFCMKAYSFDIQNCIWQLWSTRTSAFNIRQRYFQKGTTLETPRKTLQPIKIILKSRGSNLSSRYRLLYH